MATDEIQEETVALEERLKSALWLAIGKIVDEETIQLNVNATPQFIGALTEMVWAQIETVSQDLESFAKHAGRSTINVSDVMLLARRNEGLESILRAFVNQQKAQTTHQQGENDESISQQEDGDKPNLSRHTTARKKHPIRKHNSH